MLSWRLRRQEAGGGAFLDLGLPLLDLGLWLAGWPIPKRVSAHLPGRGADTVEDMGSALVVCENGVSVSVDSSWLYLGVSLRLRVDVVGLKGEMTIGRPPAFSDVSGTA